MSYSMKGVLALLRDLMAHDPRARTRPTHARTARPAPTEHGWVTTSSFDLATAAGDAHSSTATGSPLLGEQLPSLRAELDRCQGLAHKG